MTTDTFRGRLGEQTYTDPALFALDVKAQGTASQRGAYVLPSGRPDRGRTPAQMTTLTDAERAWLGCWVQLKDGREGQVWSLADLPAYVHVVLADQQTVKVHRDDLTKMGGTAKDPEGLDVLEGL